MGILFESLGRDLLAVLVVAVSAVWYFVHLRYNYWQRRDVRFEKPTFPYGNFKDSVLQRKTFGQAVTELYRQYKEPVVGLWTAMTPTLLVRDPELVRKVFINDFNTFHNRGLYCDEERDPLSGHLVAMADEKWKHMRSKLTPTFTSGKLKGMFSSLVDCGGPLDGFVNKAAERGDAVEIRELLAEYTTNIIASVAFGLEIDCIADPENDFRKVGRKVFEGSFKNGIRKTIALLFPKVMRWVGLKFVDQDVEDFMMTVVKQNMEHREKNNVSRKDFFQLLVQLRNTGKIQESDNFEVTAASDKKSLTIPECAAQAFVFFLAGFETSSTTMSFALYEFARNPKCMRRAQQEIDDVLAKHGGQLTYEAVAEMKYLEWCIDETLRVFPPVPILNREASTEWTIPNTKSTIDKGTRIMIPVLALHHDPKYWSQPESFLPERFSPEQSVGKTFVDRPYMPFGEGPRNCIGLRLGKLQTKVGLIVMLQKYNYELAGSTKLPLVMMPRSFLLSPEGGINLKITHRNNK